MSPEAFQPINQAANDYIGELRDEGFNEAMVGRLSQADMSQMGRLAQTGDMMHDDAGTLSRIISTDLGHHEYGQELRGHAMQYRAMQETSQSMQGLDRALESGNIAEAAVHIDNYTQMNNVFLLTRAATTTAASSDQHVHQRDSETNTTIAEEGLTAAEELYQSAHMMRSMTPESARGAEPFIQREIAQRQIISDAAATEEGTQLAEAVIQRSVDYYQSIGDNETAQRYERVSEALQQPQEQRTEAVQAALQELPVPENLGRTSARIAAEQESERQHRQHIVSSTEAGNYGSAMAAAAERYRYHREMGNEQMANSYLQSVQQISAMRYNPELRQAPPPPPVEEQAPQQQPPRQQQPPEQQAPAQPPQPPEQQAPEPPMPRGVRALRDTFDQAPTEQSLASEYVGSRFNHEGRGYDRLISANERYENLVPGERSPLRPKRKSRHDQEDER
jgi:hypothetical protein